MHFHLTSDLPSVFYSILNNYQSIKKGRGLWKFNNSLIETEEHALKLRHFIQKRSHFLNVNTQFSDWEWEYKMGIKWEYMKFDIRNFTSFSKLQFRTKYLEQNREI